MLAALLAAVLVGVFLPGGRAVAAQFAAPLSIDEATSLAVAQNAEVRTAALEIDKVDARIAQTRSWRLPIFEVRALAGALLTPIEFEFKRGVFGLSSSAGPIPPVDTYITTPRGFAGFLTFGAVQPLSPLYRTGLRIDQLEEERRLMVERHRARELDVAADVRRLYAGIVSAEAAASALADARALYREVERVVVEHVARDTALPADLADVRARIAETDYRLLVARHGATTFRDQLNVLLGRAPATAFAVLPGLEAEMALPDLESLVTRALASRPELREAELRARQAALDQRIAGADRLPEVALQYSGVVLGNVELLPTHISSIGVSLKWEPFDWGRRRSALSLSEKTLSQATVALEDARRRIEADVRNRHRQLDEARALVAATGLAEVAARERLRVATVRQQQDVVLYRELLAAQAAHSEAVERAGRARQAYWTAQAEITRAIGEP